MGASHRCSVSPELQGSQRLSGGMSAGPLRPGARCSGCVWGLPSVQSPSPSCWHPAPRPRPAPGQQPQLVPCRCRQWVWAEEGESPTFSLGRESREPSGCVFLLTQSVRPQRGPCVPSASAEKTAAPGGRFCALRFSAFLSCCVPGSLLPSWAVDQAWPSLFPARCAASLVPCPESRGPFREGPRFLPPHGGWGSELGVVTISDPGVKG